MSIAFNPLSVADMRDPFPGYRRLRDEAPVHRVAEADVWCLSRFDDVLGALKRPEIFSSRAMFTMLMNQGREGPPPLNWASLKFIARLFLQTRMNPMEFATARNLIAEDGASHSEMRQIVNRGFTPRQIAAREKRVHEIVAACMTRLRDGADFDVMRDLAVPLPVTIIAEMLGIEPERREDFKRWSNAFIENISGPGRDDPFSSRFTNALIGLIRYVQKIARQRRKEPADDVISAIVAEQEGGAALTDREVVQFVGLLLIAGNETTTNLIGNATTALLENRDALDRVAADPALVPQALEETLRYDGPVQLVFRTTTREVDVAGTRLPAGASVVLLLGSANRDERRFPDPDRFALDRDTRGHVGFGFGHHFCLGASLARLEARAALEALAPELVRFDFAHGERPRVDSFLVRGPQRLELAALA